MKKIIYKNEEGGVSIIAPRDNAIVIRTRMLLTLEYVSENPLINPSDYDNEESFDDAVNLRMENGDAYISSESNRLRLFDTVIESIAKKDVPAGKPYKIVNDVPLDRTFRDAWEVDEALLTDGVGSDSNEFEVLK